MKKVLILGGSFNPIHKSHLGIAKMIYERLNECGATLDEVWLMPAAQNPHKSKDDMADYQHRFAMCQIQSQGLK